MPGVKHAVDHTEMFRFTAITQSTGAIRLNSRADDQQHIRSGRSMEPHLALRNGTLRPAPGCSSPSRRRSSPPRLAYVKVAVMEHSRPAGP